MSIATRFRAAVKAFQAPAPAPARPVPPRGGELAYADPRRLFPGRQPFATHNPSFLVGTKGLAIFDEMRRDDQVKSALAVKKFACLSTGWKVQSPEGKPQNWEPTLFARWVLEHMDPNAIGAPTLDGDLYEILSALDYGYSVTEKVWDEIIGGPYDGMIGLRALKTRAPHSLTFSQDEFGNLLPDGILQQSNTAIKAGRLPRYEFVLYSYQSQFSNPYGTSDLEAAYTPWWIKYNSQKWLAMLLERFGIPPLFGIYDPARYAGAGTALDDLKKILQNLQAATTGLIPRPSGASADNKALELWAPSELGVNATRIFIPSLEYLNKGIARSILMPDLLGMTQDSSQGSYARAKVHFDVFLLVVEAIRKDLQVAIMCHQVMKPLLDMNYPGLDDYPTWSFMPLTDDLRLELLKEWNELVAGKVVVPQEDDEKHIRRLMQFPEKDPTAEVATGPETPQPETPPAAPPDNGGNG